jgi:NAD(P)-dependent dehydrogenase (short-subunit alcohol dehydrogenase family)
MDLQLQGKTALVTGAGQGVGRRIAIDLAAEGCRVVVNDFYCERAEQVAHEIVAAGHAAMPAQADVCDAISVTDMFRQMRAEFGPIDILVNNAGVPPALRDSAQECPLFMHSTIADQLGMVALNLHGTMYCCREALPDMVARRGGRVVNIISEAGRVGEARLAIYSAAKAAILGFTMALAREHGRDAITVNALALGAVVHEGIKAGPLSPSATDNAEQLKRIYRAYPIAEGLGRLGTPQDVASAVAFLSSHHAAFITGQSLGVSGGFHMQ